MEPASLVLLLIAAVLHAGINALLKQARDKLAFTWWLLGASTVLGAPLLLAGGPRDTTGWSLVVISGLLEAAYFVTLSRAYSLGDLSQVYPLARGSAPLFIVIWAGLFLHERPSTAGLCGIVMIVLGLYLINLPSLGQWARPLSGFKAAQRWALLTGLLISAYATVDKAGVAHVPTPAYLYLILAVAWVALTPLWLHGDRRCAFVDEVCGGDRRERLRKRSRIIAAALGGMAAYLLVLLAMRRSPVGYIGAVREISVVIGAWIGVRFFAEPSGRVRIVASVLVVLGVMLIAVQGDVPPAEPADIIARKSVDGN